MCLEICKCQSCHRQKQKQSNQNQKLLKSLEKVYLADNTPTNRQNLTSAFKQLNDLSSQKR